MRKSDQIQSQNLVACERRKLKVNEAKSKVMRCSRAEGAGAEVVPNGAALKRVI